jgi:hypothetical protein
MSFSSLSVEQYNATQFQSIEAYTLQLEQTPLEEFRTSAEARAVFLVILKAAANDFQWIVDEIRMSQDSLEEIKYMKLNAEYNQQYEEFIVTGKAALNRFAACFPAVKDIVLDGTHDDIDKICHEIYYISWVEDVQDALRADLTPRLWK